MWQPRNNQSADQREIRDSGALSIGEFMNEHVVAASVTDGTRVATTPIIDVKNQSEGAVALLRRDAEPMPSYREFELRESPRLIKDAAALEKKLYDARGTYRGELSGAGWDGYATRKHLLLDAYRPEKVPHPQDWILVMEAQRQH